MSLRRRRDDECQSDRPDDRTEQVLSRLDEAARRLDRMAAAMEELIERPGEQRR